VAEYPSPRWLTSSETLGAEAERYLAIRADIAAHPGDSYSARYRRLKDTLGLSDRAGRALIKHVREEGDHDEK
jgi:hypothetical protein